MDLHSLPKWVIVSIVTIVSRWDDMEASKRDFKRFPLRLEKVFSDEIDRCVFHSKALSKHQYILDAIKEKVARDTESQRRVSNE